MESDLGKLFIGGISWDTNEDRLREYFETFGEVVEAVIMKDRQTGRARGFGFVVFTDPTVAERVVMEKHNIDGRTVEAKKAVPRDEQQILNRSLNSIHGSPGPARTKKIFVGGLASTVTESDFKKYFDQFGTTTDVVVMYDHNTQRPRGFGFITYDSDDSVDRVLLKTFHELNGKMVEVKRAVPKELSPGPNRSPLPGYSYGLNRMNNFLNGCGQGYNPNSIGGHGFRMDDRFGPIACARTGFPPYGSPGYRMNMNFESPNLNSSYGVTASYSSIIGFGQGLNPYHGENSSRYNNAIGYAGGNSGSGLFMNRPSRNAWENGLNYSMASASLPSYVGSGSAAIGGFGNSSVNWSNSPSISAQGAMANSHFGGGDLICESGDTSFGFGGGSYGRNNVATGSIPAYNAANPGYEGNYADLYGGASVYGDPTWRSATSELDRSGSFYGLVSASSDAMNSAGYIDAYSVTGRQLNRGIAA